MIVSNENKYKIIEDPILEGKSLKIKYNFKSMDTNYDAITSFWPTDEKNNPYFLSEDEKFIYAGWPIRGSRIRYNLMEENPKSGSAAEISSFIIRILFRSGALIFHT